MRARYAWLAVLPFLLVLATPSPAHANTAIPMMPGAWIGMVLLLLPVILIEWIALLLGLGTPAWRSLWVVTLANLVSTLIGLPIAAILHLGAAVSASEQGLGGEVTLPPEAHDGRWQRLVTATIRIPWLIDDDGDGEEATSGWMGAVAVLTTFIVFFLASWIIEALVAALFMTDLGHSMVWRGVFVANAASYGALAGLILFWLYSAARSERKLSQYYQEASKQPSPDAATKRRPVSKPTAGTPVEDPVPALEDADMSHKDAA